MRWTQTGCGYTSFQQFPSWMDATQVALFLTSKYRRMAHFSPHYTREGQWVLFTLVQLPENDHEFMCACVECNTLLPAAVAA